MGCINCSREIPENAVFCPWCGSKQLREKKKTITVPKARKLPSGTWYIYLRYNGVDYPVSADTEDAVITKAKAIKSGLIEAEKQENTTVRDKVEEYISARSNIVSPSTLDGYKRILNTRFPALMPMRCSSVTDAVMQRAINAEAKNYSPKSVKNAYGLVSAALGKQFDVLLPTVQGKVPETLTSAQIGQLLQAIDGKGEIECAVLLAMWLSLRRSEILALRWSDIGENTITVRSARVYDDTHKLVEKPPKTVKSARTIPCPTYIINKLNALPRSSEYVFTHGTHYYWEALTRICEKNNLPHVYLHGLRHTNATVMGLLSIDSKYANKRGGWSSDKTMKGVYQQIMEEGERQAAAKIDDFFLNLIPNSK